MPICVVDFLHELMKKHVLCGLFCQRYVDGVYGGKGVGGVSACMLVCMNVSFLTCPLASMFSTIIVCGQHRVHSVCVLIALHVE